MQVLQRDPEIWCFRNFAGISIILLRAGRETLLVQLELCRVFKFNIKVEGVQGIVYKGPNYAYPFNPMPE